MDINSSYSGGFSIGAGGLTVEGRAESEIAGTLIGNVGQHEFGRFIQYWAIMTISSASGFSNETGALSYLH